MASSFARFVFVVLVVVASISAQQSTRTGTSTTGATPPTPPTTPTKGGTTGLPTVTPQPSQPTPPLPPTPIYIRGLVVLADGTEPPDRVAIERLCSTNSVRIEGYTDSKGRFGIQLGLSQQLIPDASTSMFVEPTQGFPTGTRGDNPATTAAANTDPNFDCELRARLSGYISSTVLLSGRKAMDNPDIGTLVLSPFSKLEGKAISATSASASKEARKAFDKGMTDVKKKQLDSAEKEFRKAVELHPKYAEAWLQLGKVYTTRKQSAEARDAFNHAVAADPNFVYPHEQLYQIAFEQGQWQELADGTERLLRLNPYEFPGAYYYNGVAHYQLHNWDTAEKSLNQAIQVDQRNINPKTRYVLGLVLVQKRQYEKANENLAMFTTLSPNDPQVEKARAVMDQIAKLEQ